MHAIRLRPAHATHLSRCVLLLVCLFTTQELPQYTTLEAMTERVTYAMIHCADIDTDSARR